MNTPVACSASDAFGLRRSSVLVIIGTILFMTGCVTFLVLQRDRSVRSPPYESPLWTHFSNSSRRFLGQSGVSGQRRIDSSIGTAPAPASAQVGPYCLTVPRELQPLLCRHREVNLIEWSVGRGKVESITAFTAGRRQLRARGIRVPVSNLFIARASSRIRLRCRVYHGLHFPDWTYVGQAFSDAPNKNGKGSSLAVFMASEAEAGSTFRRLMRSVRYHP